MWSPLPVMLPGRTCYSCHSPFEIHIFSHLCGFECKEMKGKCWTVSNTRRYLATSLALCHESKVWAAVFKLLLKTVTGHSLSWMQFSPNFYALLRCKIHLPFPFIGKLFFFVCFFIFSHHLGQLSRLFASDWPCPCLVTGFAYRHTTEPHQNKGKHPHLLTANLSHRAAVF